MSIIKQRKTLLIFLSVSFALFLSTSFLKPQEKTASSESSITDTTTSEVTDITEPHNISSENSSTELDTSASAETITTEESSPHESITCDNKNDPVKEIPQDEFSPSQQALLEAGFGTVILLPTGDYGILMQSPTHQINAKLGNEILRDYLTSIGLDGTIYGSWMNEDYYTFFAENLQEIISYEDEAFWD